MTITVQAERANVTDVFFADWGDELVKRTPTFQNEVLRQLVTFSAALMSGGLVLLNDTIMGKALRCAAVTMFLLALLCSFIGILPYRDDVERRSPKAIKASIQGAIGWKDTFLWAASIFIILGLALAFIGVILTLKNERPTH